MLHTHVVACATPLCCASLEAQNAKNVASTQRLRPPGSALACMREWPPLESGTLFGGGAPGGGGVESSALLAVVLNYALPPCTPAVWAAARLRVAADGGANRLFDELPALLPHRDAEEARAHRACCCHDAPSRLARAAHAALARRLQVRNAFVPAVVMGDMDSARPEVLAFYAARGALILDASDDQARARARTRAHAAAARTHTR